MSSTELRIELESKRTYEVYPLNGSCPGKLSFSDDNYDEVVKFILSRRHQDYVIFNTINKQLDYSSFEAKCRAYSGATLSESI